LPFICFAVCAVGLAILLPLWLGNFVKSSDFSKFLASQAGAALEAEAKLKALHWDGSSAASESLILIGLESSALERLEAKALRAEWNWRSLFQGAWKIENIEVQELSATFKVKEVAESGEKKLSEDERFASEPPPAGNPQIPAFFARWLPSRFEFGRFDIHKADLDFGKIKTRRNSLSISPVENGHNIEARGGSLFIPGMPPLTLAQCRMREREGTYSLDDSRAFVTGGGSIVASGSFGKNTRLNLIWEGVPASLLPVPRLVEYLDGISQGQAALDGKGDWRGSLSIPGARIHNLPGMKSIALFLRNPSWVNAAIQTLSADFEWSGGTLTLTNLVVESSGLARIEGSLRIGAGGDLSGELQLGLDQTALRQLPGARETVFTTARNGWYWSPVQLGGTLSAPSEDLSSRLATSIAGAVLLKESGKAIDAVPSKAIDTAKDIINIFAPLFP
jgi:hypothetical protein